MGKQDTFIEEHKADIYAKTFGIGDESLVPHLKSVEQTAILTLEEAVNYVNERQEVGEDEDIEDYLYDTKDVGALQEEVNRLSGTIALYSSYEGGYLLLDLCFEDINFDEDEFGDFKPFDKDILSYANWYNKEHVKALLNRIHDEGLDWY